MRQGSSDSVASSSTTDVTTFLNVMQERQDLEGGLGIKFSSY